VLSNKTITAHQPRNCPLLCSLHALPEPSLRLLQAHTNFACIGHHRDILLIQLLQNALKLAVQEAEAKQQARRDKKLAERQRRQQAAGAAKDQVRKFAGCKRSSEKHGDVKLPDAVLQKIVGCLAAFEADGVRGPSMAAHDLANAALVSGPRGAAS
jgi:hypothetical protein